MIEALDLRSITLVGHSTGCNEIVRYLSRHGSARIQRVALLGPMTPGVTLNAANPDGIDPSQLVQFREQQQLRDFPLWIEENIEPFVPGANARTKDWLAQMALDTSLQALHDCNLAVQESEISEEHALRVNAELLEFVREHG